MAIPCYNEAAAVAAGRRRVAAALPEAEIVVFDNNSTDGTGDIARRLGVRVVEVPEQGKGHAVRAIFEAWPTATPSSSSTATAPTRPRPPGLLGAVLDGSADMAVGARRPVAEAGAMSPVRGLGNVLIGAAFRLLIGPGTGDLLSGYRVFGRRFRAVVRPASPGSRSRPSWRARRSPGGCGWSRSPSRIAPGSPARPASSAPSATAGASSARSSAQSLRFRPWRPLLALAAARGPGRPGGRVVADGPRRPTPLLVAAIAPAAWASSRG